jgi:hypothetical protein
MQRKDVKGKSKEVQLPWDEKKSGYILKRIAYYHDKGWNCVEYGDLEDEPKLVSK